MLAGEAPKVLFFSLFKSVISVGRKHGTYGNGSERTLGPFSVMYLSSEFFRVKWHKVIQVKFPVILPW